MDPKEGLPEICNILIPVRNLLTLISLVTKFLKEKRSIILRWRIFAKSLWKKNQIITRKKNNLSGNSDPKQIPLLNKIWLSQEPPVSIAICHKFQSESNFKTNCLKGKENKVMKAIKIMENNWWRDLNKNNYLKLWER